jgi:glycosidase
MKRLLVVLLAVAVYGTTLQAALVNKVEPLNWWVGMKNPNLQLMVHGTNISALTPELTYNGVTLTNVERTANVNYLFLNLNISDKAQAGFVEIKLKNKNKVVETIKYELKARAQSSAERVGFNSGDVMYLITPDRYANGDTKNDVVAGFPDITDRNSPNARHGGDIQGIINNLDYIQKMGVTAIWLNPVQENNMPRTSYHGYAITDFYHVDARFGSNELYKKLSDECQKRGIKLVIDLIMNHCGTENWWYKDLPANDWINNVSTKERSNFRGNTNFDPYAANIDRTKMCDGWFDGTMADLNQRNPFMSTYLIQNSIWWVEYANLGGIRHDTHQYLDKEFVSKWAKAITNEYPNFNMVGEVWLNYPAMVAYWQKDACNKDGYNSNLPSIMDFPLHFDMRQAFTEGEGWNTGMARFYDHFSQDFLLANPMNVLVFADNHDVARFFTLMNENLAHYKMAMTLVLTTRGIPQYWAGTEFAFTGDQSKGDGSLRKDIPGGWANDSINAFTQKGLTATQIDAQNYMKLLQNWRKTSDAVKFGTMKQYIPENGVYVYFRTKDKKSVMIILNNNAAKQTLNTQRFAESLTGFTSGKEIISGKALSSLAQIEVEGKTAAIIELN